jgi:hypothetical protein
VSLQKEREKREAFLEKSREKVSSSLSLSLFGEEDHPLCVSLKPYSSVFERP